MDKLIGTRLDGLYRIDSLIGCGGMANVYKAQDLRNDRTVAVKVLREEYMHDEDLVRRFKNESKAISMLDHPNIVKVYDVSVTDKLQYIVMEYVDGITLRAYLDQRGGKLTWRETVHFTGEVLQALQHAHENGVVHRDVKPQNIMLLADGTLRMMDFGIARISRAENQLVSGKAMGSVHYISPEQAKGDVTDAKSDIYSVGILMYEMLSGTLPFEKGTVVEVAIKQISDAPPPLAERAPDVPAALVEITEHAMAKNPEERYPTAAAMLEDIRKFKEDPAIRFEYKYMPVDVPADVMDKAMKQNKTGTEPKTQKPAAKKTGKKKKLFLPTLFGVTLAFCVGCAILCLTILTNANANLFEENEDVLVNNFVGMTKNEALADPLAGKVKFVFEENYSTEYPAGTIYRQSPREGRTVKAGQEVKLSVSLGTHYEEIPPLTNMVAADAEATLKEKGLYVMLVEKVDANVPVGTVIKTDPAAGTQVESGSTVTVYVSRAQVANTTDVPSLVGLTFEDAARLLASHKLNVGVQTHTWSDIPANTIAEQGIAPGTTVKINTRVAITISDGPEPTPEPTETPSPTPEATKKPIEWPEIIDPKPQPQPKPEDGEDGEDGGEDDKNHGPNFGWDDILGGLGGHGKKDH